MKTKIIEVTNHKNGGINWGKFLVGKLDVEWARKSKLEKNPFPLLRSRGWSITDILVLDLETCEGAVFGPHGFAKADLDKHEIWVCPMYEPFLMWLYKQDLNDLDKLPDVVELDAPSALSGYRRKGKECKNLTVK